MEACAVPVFREGNVMHLAAASLDVEEACSGIRSLVSLTTLGVLYSYMTYSTWLPRVLLMAAVVPIAIVANVFRVTVTGLVAHYVSLDAAMSVFHTAGGLAVFLIAAALLLGVSRMLRLTGLAE
jgi:exosortase